MNPQKPVIKSEPMHNKAITSPKDEFWHGVRDELPMMLGVIPFGLVFGVLGIANSPIMSGQRQEDENAGSGWVA